MNAQQNRFKEPSNKVLALQKFKSGGYCLHVFEISKDEKLCANDLLRTIAEEALQNHDSLYVFRVSSEVQKDITKRITSMPVWDDCFSWDDASSVSRAVSELVKS